jgi:hypothetical protein
LTSINPGSGRGQARHGFERGQRTQHGRRGLRRQSTEELGDECGALVVGVGMRRIRPAPSSLLMIRDSLVGWMQVVA